MIGVAEALRLVLQDLSCVEGEMVPVPSARGRVLAEEISSPRDVPPFRNSAMDGFALRAEDVETASAEKPVPLQIIELIGAGAVGEQAVGVGQATQIMTGAPVPDGADTVVKVEDTTGHKGRVDIRVAVVAGANIRHPGEDVRAGDVVFRPGHVLNPADVGVLASIGLATVRVARRPRVAIIATGDELVEVGQPLGPGQIVNSNAYTLAAAVEEVGGEPVVIGIVRDEPELLRDAFSRAVRADMVLSTGGVSVGNFDYVRSVLRDVGYREVFWKVAQKPGKPISFGLCDGTPTFGLPGNPVSSLVCFYLYAVPALRAMLGLKAIHLPLIRAELREGVRSAERMTEFVRCVLEGSAESPTVRSTGSQSSGVLRSLSLGDALMIAPKGVAEIKAGTQVSVLLLRTANRAAEFPF